MRTRKEEDKRNNMVKHTTRKTYSATNAGSSSAAAAGASTGPQQITIRMVPRSTLPPTGRGHGIPAMVLGLPFWDDAVERMKEGIGPNEAIEINLPERILGLDGEEIPPKRMAARIRYQMGLLGFDKNYELRIPGGNDARRMFIVDHGTGAMNDRRRQK